MSHQTTTVTTLQVIDAQDEGTGRGDVGGLLLAAPENSSTQHSLTVRSQPSIEATTQERGVVSWSDDVIDNEHMGKKKSKKCCIYHKPRTFGEWSDSEDSDHECGHCSHS